MLQSPTRVAGGMSDLSLSLPTLAFDEVNPATTKLPRSLTGLAELATD